MALGWRRTAQQILPLLQRVCAPNLGTTRRAIQIAIERQLNSLWIRLANPPRLPITPSLPASPATS